MELFWNLTGEVSDVVDKCRRLGREKDAAIQTMGDLCRSDFCQVTMHRLDLKSIVQM